MRLTVNRYTHDLAQPFTAGDVIDAFFGSRISRVAHQALIRHHSTFRYEPVHG